MKLMLHELRAAIAASPRDELASAFKMLARVSRIMEQLVHAWDVLATMTPPEYSRDPPLPRRARSGFQSWQYRCIEFRSATRTPAMLKPHAAPARPAGAGARRPTSALALRRGAAPAGAPRPAGAGDRMSSATGPSPTRTATRSSRPGCVVYREPEAHWDLYQLGEELTDLEDAFRALALPPRDDGRARHRLQARHRRHRRRELPAQDARRGAVPRDLAAAHGSLGWISIGGRCLTHERERRILAELVHRWRLHAIHPSLCRAQRRGTPRTPARNVALRTGRAADDRPVHAEERRATIGDGLLPRWLLAGAVEAGVRPSLRRNAWRTASPTPPSTTRSRPRPRCRRSSTSAVLPSRASPMSDRWSWPAARPARTLRRWSQTSG